MQISRKSVSVLKKTELGLLRVVSVITASRPLGSCELARSPAYFLGANAAQLVAALLFSVCMHLLCLMAVE